MKKRKKEMPPIEVDGVEYRCGNAHFWPPPEVEYLEASAEQLRYTVPGVVYQRIKTWEQACGQIRMDVAKCSGCKWVVVDGNPVTEVGTGLGSRVMSKRLFRQTVNEKGRKQ